MTPTHHLPVGAKCCAELKMAKDLSVGEYVWRAHNDTTIVSHKVTRLSMIVGAGLHNPLMTHGGYPVVDGIVNAIDDLSIRREIGESKRGEREREREKGWEEGEATYIVVSRFLRVGYMHTTHMWGQN